VDKNMSGELFLSDRLVKTRKNSKIRQENQRIAGEKKNLKN